MSRTPARKRGEDGRLLPLDEARPDRQDGSDGLEEGEGWEGEGWEGFGSVGPAAFGTPEQQASLRSCLCTESHRISVAAQHMTHDLPRPSIAALTDDSQ